MKHIVLLGASNSLVSFRLREGLASNENVKLINLSLGAVTALYHIYEMCRERNQEILKNADLIILESNITDVVRSNDSLNLEIAIRNIAWLYDFVYSLKKEF